MPHSLAISRRFISYLITYETPPERRKRSKKRSGGKATPRRVEAVGSFSVDHSTFTVASGNGAVQYPLDCMIRIYSMANGKRGELIWEREATHEVARHPVEREEREQRRDFYRERQAHPKKRTPKYLEPPRPVTFCSPPKLPDLFRNPNYTGEGKT